VSSSSSKNDDDDNLLFGRPCSFVVVAVDCQFLLFGRCSCGRCCCGSVFLLLSALRRCIFVVVVVAALYFQYCFDASHMQINDTNTNINRSRNNAADSR
jgi:hypothetical protein